MKRLIFSGLISLLLLVSFGKAYDLNCEIDPQMSNFEKYTYVTTKSFRLNITFTNVGEWDFPNTLINVTIFDPNHRIVEPYYNFKYPMDFLPSRNSSSNYLHRWSLNNDSYAVFELATPGTWEIRAQLLSTPNDNVTIITHDNILRLYECRRYFSVKEFSTYLSEKKNDELQETNLDLNGKILDLTILTVILASLTLAKRIYNLGRDYGDIVVPTMLAIISVIYLLAPVKVPLPLIGDIGLITSLIILVFAISIALNPDILYKKTFAIPVIFLLSYLAIITFSLSITNFEKNFRINTIMLLISFILFGSVAYLLEKIKSEFKVLKPLSFN